MPFVITSLATASAYTMDRSQFATLMSTAGHDVTPLTILFQRWYVVVCLVLAVLALWDPVVYRDLREPHHSCSSPLVLFGAKLKRAARCYVSVFVH